MSEIDDFKNELARNEMAFDADSGNASHLVKILSLSTDEIATLSGGDGAAAHGALIDLLQEATEHNMQQAQLLGRITDLGESAMSIAKLIPSLAAKL